MGTHWQPLNTLNTLQTPRKCQPGVGSGQVGVRCQPLGKQPHGTELTPPRQAGSADLGKLAPCAESGWVFLSSAADDEEKPSRSSDRS